MEGLVGAVDGAASALFGGVASPEISPGDALVLPVCYQLAIRAIKTAVVIIPSQKYGGRVCITIQWWCVDFCDIRIQLVQMPSPPLPRPPLLKMLQDTNRRRTYGGRRTYRLSCCF